MYMTSEASGFYLARTLPFMTVAELAKRCGVSRPTIERWAELGLVPIRAQPAFEAVLDDLAMDFQKKAKQFPQPNFYNQLERAMLDAEPKRVSGAGPDERINEFLAYIKPKLKKGISSREVFDIAQRYGLPRQRVYRLTDQLGVQRHVVGFGRNMKSTWRLK